MRIAILGAKGALGSALVRLCQRKKAEHVAAGREEADITDPHSLRQFIQHARPTHIVNCAAYTAVDAAEKEKERAYAINATGPENLGKVAKLAGIKVVHVSTDFVFDGKKETPYTEADPCHPLSTYGMSKWEGEKRLLHEDGSACIVRGSWLIGKGGKNFASQLLHEMGKKNKIHVVSDLQSSPTYIHDFAEALFQLLDQEGIFHFSNRGNFSLYELAKSLQEAALEKGISLACEEIVPVPSSTFPALAERPAYSVLSTEKVAHVAKLAPRSWEECLPEVIDELS